MLDVLFPTMTATAHDPHVEMRSTCHVCVARLFAPPLEALQQPPGPGTNRSDTPTTLTLLAGRFERFQQTKSTAVSELEVLRRMLR